MKKCLNPRCGIEFEEKTAREKYCSLDCCQFMQRWKRTKEEREKNIQSLKDWAAKNPEKAKEVRERGIKRRYLAGRLAPWMYS
jgi:hypothetical protein